MKTAIKLFILLLLSINTVHAQCPDGSSSLSGNGTVSINSGQTYCLDYGQEFTGNITINGGTLYIKGMCVPSQFQFYAGEIVNYGLLSLHSFTGGGKLENHLDVEIANDMLINNGELLNEGKITVKGSLSSNRSFTNNGQLRVDGNFTSNGVFSNTNFIQVKGNATNNNALTNSQYIEIKGNLQNNNAISNTGNIVASNYSDKNLADLKRSIIVDQFGNEIDREKLKITSHCHVAGYFKLHFMDEADELVLYGKHYESSGFGFDDPVLGAERREVFIRVCEDLSALIQSDVQEGEIDILVTRTLPSGVKEAYDNDSTKYSELIKEKYIGALGRGHVFYETSAENEIVLPIVQKYLQSGTDPYYGQKDKYYHALMDISFFNGTSLRKWNSDLTAAPQDDEHDLYTILLHEMLHIIGFAPRLNLNQYQNSLIINAETLGIFDTFITTGEGEKVIDLNYETANITGAINPSITVEANDTYYFDLPGTEEDVLLWYKLNDQFTHSSFSHVGSTASSDYYVMPPAFKYGDIQRYPHLDEVNILAALGYKTTGVYGDNISEYLELNLLKKKIDYQVNSGNEISIAQDDFFTVRLGEEITIDYDEILANDEISTYDGIDFFPVDGVEKYYSYNNDFPNCNIGTIQNSSTSIKYLPNVNEQDNSIYSFNYWVNYIKYLPYKIINGEKEYQCSGYIVIKELFQKLLNSDNCPSDLYNYVCDGGFEEGIDAKYGNYTEKRENTFNRDVFHWNSLSASPDYYISNDGTNFYWEAGKNTGFGKSVHIGGFVDFIFAKTSGESAYGILNENLNTSVLYNVGINYCKLYDGSYSFGIYLHNEEQIIDKIEGSWIDINENKFIENTSETIFEGELNNFGYKNYTYSQIIPQSSTNNYIILKGLDESTDKSIVLIDDVMIEKAVIQSSAVSKYQPSINETVTIQYTIFNPRKDNSTNEEPLVFKVDLNSLPEDVVIVSANGDFDAEGNYTIPAGGITEQKTITLALKGISANASGIEFYPSVEVVSAEGTTNDGLIYTENSPIEIQETTSLTWDQIMANGHSGTNPSGESYDVAQVGPQNTQAIRDEVINHPEIYEGMDEQESTIAAAENLYGKGCVFAISAQDAWFALGEYDKYEQAVNYIFVSPADDISGTNEIYHAANDITASNVINNNADVELRAGNSITLQPGFHSASSKTHAFIVKCASFEVKNGEDIGGDIPETEVKSHLSVTLKPNPTSGYFSIESNEAIQLVKISTSSGTVISTFRNAGYELPVNINAMPSGIYYVQVATENETVVEKLILNN